MARRDGCELLQLSATIWAELGIEPTNDAGLIRRAYATRLKATRPEADPAGFGRLRAAFETALRQARTGRATAQKGAVFAPRLTVAVEPVTPRPPDDADIVRHHLATGDLPGAADALAGAIDRAALPLDIEIQLKDQLLRALVDDRKLDGAAVKTLAERFGWARAGAPGDAALLRSLDAKFEAWDWYAETLRIGDSRRYWLGDEAAAAARTMTGRPDPVARILPPVPDLKRQLGLLRYHGRWIGQHFEQAPIEKAQLLAAKRYPGRLGRALWVVTVVAALIAIIFATPMVFLPLILRLPYVRIQALSRAALFAYASMVLACALLTLALPTSLPALAGAPEARDMETAFLVDCVIILAVIVGIKQLFLPGKRTR